MAGARGLEPLPHGFGDRQATITTCPCIGVAGENRTHVIGFADRPLASWVQQLMAADERLELSLSDPNPEVLPLH